MSSYAPISVIIPCYNVDAYIGEALKSLASLELMPKEVIVVDDGSTDNTVCEVQKFHHLLDIKLSRIKNSGQGVARNFGIAIASAPYVYFLDADDKVCPAIFSRLSCVLDQYSWPDLLFFSGRAFRDDSYHGSFSRSYARKLEFSPASSQRAIVRIGKDRLFSASPCMYVSKRHLWGKNGISFRSMVHEDEDVLYRLILSSRWVAVIGDELFLRRLRNHSTMTEPKTSRHVHGRYEILQSALDDLKVYRDFPLSARWALRKRVFWMALSYFKVCDQAGQDHRFRTIFRQALYNGSPELMLATLASLVLAQLKFLTRRAPLP